MTVIVSDWMWSIMLDVQPLISNISHPSQFPDLLRMDDFVYQKTAPKKKKMIGGESEVKSLSDRKPASSKVSDQW